MRSRRSDVAIFAAIGALIVATGVAWYAALDAPAAESPRGLPAEGWVPQAAPTPQALPALAIADALALARPSGFAPRPDAPPPLSSSGPGTLVSHGSGVWVQAAPSSGAGRELGLAEGDRIVRINGRAVTQAAEVATLLTQRPAEGLIRIDGLRNGKPISLYHVGHEVSSPPE